MPCAAVRSETELKLRQYLVLKALVGLNPRIRLRRIVLVGPGDDAVVVELKFRGFCEEDVEAGRVDVRSRVGLVNVLIEDVDAHEGLIRLGPPVVVLALVLEASLELLAEAEEERAGV